MPCGEDMDRPDEKILDRYIKVRKLANESPQEGERLAARKKLERWQEEWRLKGINLDREATIWEGLQNSTEEPESRHWSDVYEQQQAEQEKRREAEWKQKFAQWGQAASSAFSWAAGMASQAFAMQEIQVLASEDSYTRIQVRTNPTGSMSINIRIAPEAVDFTSQLSEEQKLMYANTVASRVASQILSSI